MKRKLTPFTLPVPGFGERRMTEADFNAACEREGITVLSQRLPEGINGCCSWPDGKPTIVIRPRLSNYKRLHAQFHELGHYFLHGNQKHLLRVLTSEEPYTPLQLAAEVEADTAALVAIAPGFPINFWLRAVTPDAFKSKTWAKVGVA